jgi:hypothetical protein
VVGLIRGLLFGGCRSKNGWLDELLKQVLLNEAHGARKTKEIHSYWYSDYLAYKYVALHPCTLSPRERKGKGVW